MFSRFVVLSVLLALTIAQNTTTSLFIYGGIFPNPEYRQPPLLASVIGSKPPITTYVLNCNSGNISDECGLAEPLTLVNGPSTASWSTYLVPGLTDYFTCTITDKTTGTCTISQTRAANFTTTEGEGLASSDIANTVESFTFNRTDVTYRPVIITAGEQAATSNSGTATTRGTGSAGSATPAGTPSGSGATVTTAEGSTGTASASASANAGSSSEGVPCRNQNIGFLLWGAFITAGLIYGAM